VYSFHQAPMVVCERICGVIGRDYETTRGHALFAPIRAGIDFHPVALLNSSML